MKTFQSLGLAALLASLPFFTACTLNSAKQTTSQPGLVAGKPAKTKEQATDHLPPAQMYNLMLGEILVQKGELEDAFHLIYPVAKQTKDPGLIERSFQLSMNTYDIANIEKSAALWREVSPDEPTAWRVGYLMELRKGNLKQAIKHWDIYRLKSDLSLEEDLQRTASQAVQSSEPEVGLAFFKAMYEKYPESWAAGYAYGFAADQYQQPDLAVEVLEQAASKPGAPSEVFFSLANIYIDNELIERGLAYLNDYVVKNPEDWAVQERYARLEVKNEQYDKAQTRYENIVKNNPDANTSKLSLSLLYLDKNELNKSQRLLEDLVNQEGYQDVSHYYLGMIAKARKQNNLALHHLQKVEHPSYALDAQLLISQIKFETQGLREAIELLDQIDLADVESRIKVWRTKAVYYAQMRDFKRAREFYAKSYETSNKALNIGYAYAMALYELRDFQTYESVLLELNELYPAEPEALNALGYFYVEQNIKLDKAQKLLDQALELSPASPHILDSRGWLAYLQKDYLLAEKLLQKAWGELKDEVVLIHLIKTKQALNKIEEARKLWQENHQDFQENKELQELGARLK